MFALVQMGQEANIAANWLALTDQRPSSDTLFATSITVIDAI